MNIVRLAPTITGSVTTIRATVGKDVRASIYYAFDGDFCPSPDGIGNAALLAFLPYAMCHGLDIAVEGAVDSDLLEKLEEVQDAWTRWAPEIFTPVDISAEEIRPCAPATARTAVVAFSGGLDATYAVHAHKRRLIGRRSLDIQAGLLIQGFDIPLDRDDWFEAARRSAEAVLANYDIPLATVRTNWRDLDPPWEQAHMFVIASVLHQLKGVFGRGIIASDYSYENDILGWGSNSISNQMLSSVGFPLQFTGGGSSRTEKAGAVGGEAAVLNNLRVCFGRPGCLGNCGSCDKCIRTKLNFMANGILDVPALGARVTPEQVERMWLGSESGMQFFRELERLPWAGEPAMKAALSNVVKRGIVRPRGFQKIAYKYKRSLRKRGLWPNPVV